MIGLQDLACTPSKLHGRSFVSAATLTAKELDAEPESIVDAKVASRSRPAARFAHAMETAFIGTSELVHSPTHLTFQI